MLNYMPRISMKAIKLFLLKEELKSNVDLFVDYFYLGFSILRIKADYLLITIGLILLFGLVSSICSSYKALKGSPTNVINGH